MSDKTVPPDILLEHFRQAYASANEQLVMVAAYADFLERRSQSLSEILSKAMDMLPPDKLSIIQKELGIGDNGEQPQGEPHAEAQRWQ